MLPANQTISETLATIGEILPVSASTGSLYSNFFRAGTTNRYQAKLSVGSITGTADISLEQAFPNLNAVGITTTASASASDTTLAVSGGTFAVNDWVSADGVNFVRVTVAKTTSAAGNLTVTALPAAVASGASVIALGNALTVAALSTGRTTGEYPFAPIAGQTPALASAAGVYTLDVRASDVNNNNPAAQTNGTANGYNPVTYFRIKITLAVGSTSAVVGGELLNGINTVPAYNFQCAEVINQIQA